MKISFIVKIDFYEKLPYEFEPKITQNLILISVLQLYSNGERCLQMAQNLLNLKN